MVDPLTFPVGYSDGEALRWLATTSSAKGVSLNPNPPKRGIRQRGEDVRKCSLFRVGLLSRKPLSPKHRSTFLPLQHTATLIFSVDWGLTKFGKTLRVVDLTMGELEEIVHLVAANAIAHGDVESDADAVAELYEALVEKAVHESPAIILKDINRNSSTGLRRRRRARQGFEGRLWKHWKKPLLSLELMVELAHEIGVGIGDQVREETPITYDYTFIALQAIHARACQMSRAILALLRAGFPDDAHARWRSLHELAVVSAFISECEEDVAERYVLHEVVEQRKLAQHYKGSETWNQLDPGSSTRNRGTRDQVPIVTKPIR